MVSDHNGNIFSVLRRIYPEGEYWYQAAYERYLQWGESSHICTRLCMSEAAPCTAQQSSPSLKGCWPCWFGKPCRWDVAKHPLSLSLPAQRPWEHCGGVASPAGVLVWCVYLPLPVCKRVCVCVLHHNLSLAPAYRLLGLNGGFHRSSVCDKSLDRAKSPQVLWTVKPL